MPVNYTSQKREVQSKKKHRVIIDAVKISILKWLHDLMDMLSHTWQLTASMDSTLFTVSFHHNQMYAATVSDSLHPTPL